MKIFLLVLLLTACTASHDAEAETPKSEKPNCEHTDTAFYCVTYVKNYDADTITFNIKGLHPIIGNKISIRVNGIDTPEMRGGSDCEKKRSIESKLMVQKMMKEAKQIDLLNISKGKYFRIVADVMVDGNVSVAKMLMDTGYAYPYDGGTKLKIDWCRPLAEQIPKEKPTKDHPAK